MAASEGGASTSGGGKATAASGGGGGEPSLVDASSIRPVTLRLASTVIGYSLCNSQLLIINKVALAYLPAPCFLLFTQLAASAVAVQTLARLQIVEADNLEWEKSKGFMIVVFTFVLTLFANMKSIQHAPVDTFICLRSTSPLILAGLDYLFLGRELPSRRSFMSLLGIMCGVLLYVNHDYNFSVQAYLWIAVWYVVSIFELIYVKHLVSTSSMTTWGQTYYQNVLSVPFLAIMFIGLNETSVLAQSNWSPGCIIVILLSCAAGLGMSFLSFALRNMISATSFAIVGNMCKVGTIVVNSVIWDQHSNSTGILALMMCLGSGAMYSQAPLRAATYQDREICPCLPRPLYRQIENVLMRGVLGKVLLSIPAVLLCAACAWALYKDRNEARVLNEDPFARSNPFEVVQPVAQNPSLVGEYSPPEYSITAALTAGSAAVDEQ